MNIIFSLSAESFVLGLVDPEFAIKFLNRSATVISDCHISSTFTESFTKSSMRVLYHLHHGPSFKKLEDVGKGTVANGCCLQFLGGILDRVHHEMYVTLM